MSHRGKWKRRRPHTVPVLHRTLHRYSWERSMRHEAAGQALSGLRHIGGLFLSGITFLLAFCVLGALFTAAFELIKRFTAK